MTSCTCTLATENVQLACVDVAAYEESETVTWREKPFTKVDLDAPSLLVLGPELIHKSMERLDVYINMDFLTKLSVLSPKNFPAGAKGLAEGEMCQTGFSGNQICVYAKSEIEFLASQFGIHPATLVQDWAKLIHAILHSPSWDALRTFQRNTDVFWSHALRDQTLPWEDSTRLFIRTIKTLAPGSSMVESSFSVFKSIKNQTKTRISDRFLTAIMKMAINGPR